jgi:tRNA pseudouridine38-40 synthase
MNIKIILAYDGSCFNGSQKQPNKNTVQDKLEEVLKIIGITNKINFSGRTDKNVHACGQVVSLTILYFWHNLSKLKQILNKYLPNSIVIKDIQEVNNLFHARFSAKKRVYRYILSTAKPSPFQDKYVYFCENINEKKINSGIAIFQGIHDFKYFSKNGSDPKSTIREIYSIKFYKYQNLYIFKFTANSYLRSQIRMIVSFLLKISQGKLTIHDLQNQLNCKKLISWTLAPPNGLYLTKVTYDNLPN